MDEEIGEKDPNSISSNLSDDEDDVDVDIDEDGSGVESFYFNGPNSNFVVYIESSVLANKKVLERENSSESEQEESLGKIENVREGDCREKTRGQNNGKVKHQQHGHKKRIIEKSNEFNKFSKAQYGDDDLKKNRKTNVKTKELKGNQKTYTCYLCSFTTHLRQERNIHLLKEHNDSFNYDAKDSLTRADKLKMDISTSTVFRCSLCSFKTHKEKKYNGHITNGHRNISNLTKVDSPESRDMTETEVLERSDQCNFPGTNTSSFNSKNKRGSTQRRSCRYCKYRSSRTDNLRRHEWGHKCDFFCEICGLSDIQRSMAANHLKNFHKMRAIRKKGKGNFKYLCLNCKKRIKTTVAVKSHSCSNSLDKSLKQDDASTPDDEGIVIRMGDYILNIADL